VVILILAAIASSKSAQNTTSSSAGSSSASSSSVVGVRSNPVPFGQSANVDGWTVKVISVNPEATDSLEGAPPAGTLFEVFTLQVTNTSTTPAAPSTSLISDLVGSSNVSHSVITNPMCYGGSPDNDNVYQGGTVQFGACISVPSGVTNLELNVSDLLGTNTTWFAIG